jgi:DNA (cytosine-5)-methyltransferase 1
MDNNTHNIKRESQTLQDLLKDGEILDESLLDTTISVDISTHKVKEPLNFVEIFSGCGGMCQGLNMAGNNGLAALEWWEPGVKTLRKNQTYPIIHGDVTLSETKDQLYKTVGTQKVHIVAGGFPCQGFSTAGKRDITDPRNRLYLELLEIVSHLKPDFVLMENVKGLISMANGKVLKLIRSDFYRIGYKLDFKLLNAADYGVPQARERVIIIGNKIGKKNPYPIALLDKKSHITVCDAIADLMDKPEDIPSSHIFSKHDAAMVTRLAKIPLGKNLYGNFSDAWKRPLWSKPSPTVKENHGGVFVHPFLPRVMTPRELARLQSFPDTYLFEGKKSHILKQLGNAVPPLLAKALGLAISTQY